MQSKPGLLRRLFGGAWRTLNFTRQLVINLIFLTIIVVLLGAVFGSRPTLKRDTALVIAPSGAIVEQYSTDPASRALSMALGSPLHEVQLRDLLTAIERAGDDARIKHIVFIPDEITGVGLATAREIGAALLRFRDTGKQVLTFSRGMSQGQYAIAMHSDEIVLDPEGMLMLEGLSSYRNYYKDALDKLGIDIHLIKVGAYKSAAEPYVLNAASDEAREASLYWMDGLWTDYLEQVAAARQLDVATLRTQISNYDKLVAAHRGDLAQLALSQGLVDRIAPLDELREELRDIGAAEQDSFRQVSFESYLNLPDPRGPMPGTSQVGVVVAQGNIVPGKQPQGTVGGDSTAALLRAARNDDNIKALVLRVDSPGGDVGASEQIRREIELTQAAGKPVIVSMGDVAASGGYWISMNAQRILAQPNTITGSIGIFGMFPTIPEAMDKIGVHVDGVGTTPLAGAFDPRRELSPQIESILVSVIGRGYEQFIGRVAKARGQTTEQIDQVAQGRVWSGEQALQRGLVDELGGLHEAIAIAAQEADLGTDYRSHYVERQPSTWERVMLGMSGDAMAGFAATLMPPLLGVLPEHELRQLQALRQTLSAQRPVAYAHCFCDIQ